MSNRGWAGESKTREDVLYGLSFITRFYFILEKVLIVHFQLNNCYSILL